MKKRILVILASALVVILATSAVNAEPKGSKDKGSKKAEKAMMKAERKEPKAFKMKEKEERKARISMDKEEREASKEIKGKDSDDDDKYAKQREKHTEYREEGKGSETGQASREEHRKKWWKFWE